MGEVYLARDTKLGRDVALKILPPVFVGDPDLLARFSRKRNLSRRSIIRTSAQSMGWKNRAASARSFWN